MNEQQMLELIKQLKQQFKKACPNKSDDEINEMILDVFFKAYCEGKMSREDLTAFTELMGYEVKDEILDEIEKEKKELDE